MGKFSPKRQAYNLTFSPKIDLCKIGQIYLVVFVKKFKANEDI